MKFAMTKIAAGLILAAAATGAQADAVLSLTIEEIGASGVGSSAAGTGGGLFYFATAGAQPDGSSGIAFTSDGTDGAILPGTVQASGAMSTGFLYSPNPGPNNFFPNSCGAAQSGCTGSIGASYAGGVLTLNLASWGGYYSSFNTQFTLFPNGDGVGNDQPLVVSASALGAGGLAANQFYYTADWSHTIAANEPGGMFFGGQVADWHLEGVGTVAAVPEASTYGMMLAGLGLVGFAVRRRKLVA